MRAKTIRDRVTLSSDESVLDSGYAAALLKNTLALRLIVKAFYAGMVRNKSLMLIGIGLCCLLGACTAPVFEPKDFVFILFTVPVGDNGSALQEMSTVLQGKKSHHPCL